jgi:hypothetical protein
MEFNEAFQGLVTALNFRLNLRHAVPTNARATFFLCGISAARVPELQTRE